MTWLITLLLGFALGLEAGRMAAGRKINWKRALATLFIAAAVAAILTWRANRAAPDEGQVLCAQDVQLCADGTYVGRIAPNCDFAPCPGGRQ